MTAPLRLATRGSPLALAQAYLVRNSLAEAHGWDPEELDEICPIQIFKTSGDRMATASLAQVGGKGLHRRLVEAPHRDQRDRPFGLRSGDRTA